MLIQADSSIPPLPNYGQGKTRTQFPQLPTASDRVAVDETPMRETLGSVKYLRLRSKYR